MMVRHFSNTPRENRRGFGIWLVPPGALLLGFLLGCGEPEPIREYTVDKTAGDQHSLPAMTAQSKPAGQERMLAAMVPHGRMAWFFKLTGPDAPVQNEAQDFLKLIQSVTFSPKGTPEWKLPEKWKQEGQSGMRFATITIPTSDPALEMTVIPLPMPENGDQDQYALENVNRWRRQVGLSPIEKAELKDHVIEVTVADSQALVVNLLGQKSAGMPGRPPFANLRPNPPMAPQTPPSQTGPQTPTFEVPTGWTAAKNDTFSKAAFEVRQEGQSIRITLTPLGPLGNTLPFQVNRWRGQLGLPPMQPNEIDKAIEKIEAGDLTGFYVKLVSPESAQNRQAILAGILPQTGRSWYVKLKGDAALALKQEPQFKTFVQSVRFSPAEEAGE